MKRLSLGSLMCCPVPTSTCETHLFLASAGQSSRARQGRHWWCRLAARCRARRRRPEHQEQLGGQHQVHQGQGWPPRRRCSPSGQGQSRDERGRCATSRSSETGSGHESSGSAWIDWKVRVCAMRNLGN